MQRIQFRSSFSRDSNSATMSTTESTYTIRIRWSMLWCKKSLSVGESTSLPLSVEGKWWHVGGKEASLSVEERKSIEAKQRQAAMSMHGQSKDAAQEQAKLIAMLVFPLFSGPVRSIDSNVWFSSGIRRQGRRILGGGMIVEIWSSDGGLVQDEMNWTTEAPIGTTGCGVAMVKSAKLLIENNWFVRNQEDLVVERRYLTADNVALELWFVVLSLFVNNSVYPFLPRWWQ